MCWGFNLVVSNLHAYAPPGSHHLTSVREYLRMCTGGDFGDREFEGVTFAAAGVIEVHACGHSSHGARVGACECTKLAVLRV